jgi:hypothetical protein
MTNAAGAPTSAETLGVVDPMRIPGSGAVARSWRRLPTLGRVFVALAIIDAVARILRLVEPSVDLDLSAPLGLIAGFLPRTLWILLPAIIVARRTDAARTVPWILRGALTLALTTLVAAPLHDLVTEYRFVMEPEVPSIAISFATNLLIIGAWLMLAKGFLELRSRPAAPIAAVLANLIAVGFVASVAIELVFALRSAARGELFGDFWFAMLVLNGITALGLMATAAGLWAIVRGLDDPRRPGLATRFGVAAATLWASTSVLSSMSSAWFLMTEPALTGGSGMRGLELFNLISLVPAIVAPTLLVAAFALGLADRDITAREADLHSAPS